MRKFYFITLIAINLSSCKKWDKPEQVPSYIYIERIDLSVTSTQGTASHGIIDAWVYINKQPVGVFDLPCTIPVLYEGNQQIDVYPGIKNDGLTESRAKYIPYLEYSTSAIELKPGKISSLTGAFQPVVTYKPSTEIEIWEENFDDAAVNFNADPNSDAGVTFVSDSVNSFEGTGMGKIELSSSLSYARVLTSQSFILPKSGKTVYVELNYNTNNSMAVGIQAIDGSELTSFDNTILNATNGEWKKVYVKLTDRVSTQVNADAFKFILTITKDTEGATVVNYIDNFKVVYVK